MWGQVGWRWWQGQVRHRGTLPHHLPLFSPGQGLVASSPASWPWGRVTSRPGRGSLAHLWPWWVLRRAQIQLQCPGHLENEHTVRLQTPTLLGPTSWPPKPSRLVIPFCSGLSSVTETVTIPHMCWRPDHQTKGCASPQVTPKLYLMRVLLKRSVWCKNKRKGAKR